MQSRKVEQSVQTETPLQCLKTDCAIQKEEDELKLSHGLLFLIFEARETLLSTCFRTGFFELLPVVVERWKNEGDKRMYECMGETSDLAFFGPPFNADEATVKLAEKYWSPGNFLRSGACPENCATHSLKETTAKAESLDYRRERKDHPKSLHGKVPQEPVKPSSTPQKGTAKK